ncbi:MAG: glycosyltransferase [Bacteroidales bacterium]|nr:glycosyltransferase [Bacteroidales bacterium]
MIPKVIHYCWFGGKPKPKDVEYCLSTWRKFCPDYTIKEWNEGNFDVHINRYCEEAYANKKWAFVSDVARLYALIHEGGIYMDTDVEVVKSFDDLLGCKAFLGFEGTRWIATSAMGTEADNPILSLFYENYHSRSFVKAEGGLDKTTNVEALTNLLVKEQGLILNGHRQSLKCFDVFPTDFFTPYDYINGKLKLTENTHTIHWFNQSWIGHRPLKVKLSQFYHRLIGMKME